MPIHKESIFRYLLICFGIAAFGLLASWNKMETERHLNMASTAEASLSIQLQGQGQGQSPGQGLPLSNSETSQAQ